MNKITSKLKQTTSSFIGYITGEGTLRNIFLMIKEEPLYSLMYIAGTALAHRTSMHLQLTHVPFRPPHPLHYQFSNLKFDSQFIICLQEKTSTELTADVFRIALYKEKYAIWTVTINTTVCPSWYQPTSLHQYSPDRHIFP